MTRRSNRAEHEKAAPSRSRALTVRAKCSSKTAFIFSKTASMDQNRCVASPGSHELRDHRCRSVTARTRDRITDPTESRARAVVRAPPRCRRCSDPAPGRRGALRASTRRDGGRAVGPVCHSAAAALRFLCRDTRCDENPDFFTWSTKDDPSKVQNAARAVSSRRDTFDP